MVRDVGGFGFLNFGLKLTCTHEQVRIADARLQAELLEAKNELQRLREHVSLVTTPTVHKDLSLVFVIPRWSGSDATVTLEEFLESIEA